MTKRLPPKPKFMQKCGLCGSSFQFGPHIYDGKHIARYQLTVCRGCWDANYDGWCPALEPALLAHLESKGIAVPERNADGWLPRE